MKRRYKVLIIIALMTVLVLSNVYQNRHIAVKEYLIYSEKVPTSFESFKIVQVTDLHSITDGEFGEMLSELIRQQSPDMIAITGDLIDSTIYSDEAEALEKVNSDSIAGEATVEFVAGLVQIAPVYFVYGNHEMILLDDPERNSFKVALEDLGVNFVNNEVFTLEKDSDQINIIGIQDPATLYKDPVFADSGETSKERTIAMLDVVTQKVDNSLFTILLAHRPEFFEIYADYPLDLALTGHAHGGQIRIPFIREGIYAPNQGFFPEYTNGLYSENSFSMIVGRGLGNSVFPCRVFNGPELVAITLTNSDKYDSLQEE